MSSSICPESRENAELSTLLTAADKLENERELDDEDRIALAQLCVRHNMTMPRYDDDTNKRLRNYMPSLFKEEVENVYSQPDPADEVASDINAPRAPNPLWRKYANSYWRSFCKLHPPENLNKVQVSQMWLTACHLGQEKAGELKPGTQTFLEMMRNYEKELSTS
jgi:hypothetical protein